MTDHRTEDDRAASKILRDLGMSPEIADEALRVLAKLRSPEEPSDAQVIAAARAYVGDEMSDEEWEWVQTQPDVIQPYLDGMRAALRAANLIPAGP